MTGLSPEALTLLLPARLAPGGALHGGPARGGRRRAGDGLRALPNQTHYSASKHAVAGLAGTAAIELAPRRIRVNSVHPWAWPRRWGRTARSGGCCASTRSSPPRSGSC
ncbi:SDR family NAD(P)-dependent oxidoreductase [Pseudonocardia parietis]|uniref:SDR family NAD(P)-dependent oxidoreductase n=1 Tax=Pseudonocardia parietis TaxID=570936 RepID=UPI00247B1605|nr:SDR family NAD(P)-dependent oxidoreductase [Pseudonocardia parietis]